MTLLVAVKSCQYDRNRGCHQIIRQTWGRDIPVLFFMGGTTLDALAADEVILNCPDNKESLAFKTRAICEWANNRCDYIFLCDNDSFLVPKRLVACEFEKYDYAGKIDTLCKVGETAPYKDCQGNFLPKCHPFASGGYGYFLSRRAMIEVASNDPAKRIEGWAEDLFVGQVIGEKIQSGEFTGYNIPNFPRNMSWHFLKRPGVGYEPYNGWQEKLYKENQ